ncbi:hypothetical protein ADJ73_14725 [Arsenicicoccus sp. oral taxon 190]|nr:hypothetical protein ADJ73_14725 [Arsenicicoccus sp. oral taxon 190]
MLDPPAPWRGRVDAVAERPLGYSPAASGNGSLGPVPVPQSTRNLPCGSRTVRTQWSPTCPLAASWKVDWAVAACRVMSKPSRSSSQPSETLSCMQAPPSPDSSASTSAGGVRSRTRPRTIHSVSWANLAACARWRRRRKGRGASPWSPSSAR